jgi:hypothetical protein
MPDNKQLQLISRIQGGDFRGHANNSKCTSITFWQDQAGAPRLLTGSTDNTIRYLLHDIYLPAREHDR